MHRSQGGSNDPMNLVTLCWKCHAVAHGTILPEYGHMLPVEIHEACIEYVADMYAPDWWPWEDGGL